MTTKKTAPSSTDPACPLAVPAGRLPQPMVVALARPWGLPTTTDAAELARAIGERERVQARLARVSEHGLVALALLVEMGGSSPPSVLARAMTTRVPCSQEEALDAIDEVLSSALAITATRAWHDERVELLSPAAERVAELLGALGLPTAAPPPARGVDAPDPELRDAVALSLACAHRTLRATRSGEVNRSSVKPFAKAIGSTPERVEALVEHATPWLDLLPEPGGFVPNLDELRAFAREGTVAGHFADRAFSHVGEAWVSVEALARALRRAVARAPLRSGWGTTDAHAEVVVRVARATGWVVAEHAGHAWVRRPRPGDPESPDGHVTPNLEVMLGPKVALARLVEIGLGAELVRLDRVLTYRITAQSVRRGLEHGLDVERFFEALAGASRHGVPDNVAATVRDFARGVARVRRAWLVELPAPLAARAFAELGPERARLLGEGCIAVDEVVPERTLVAALERAGARPVVALATERDEDARERDPSAGPEVSADDLAAPQGDAAIARRIERARAEGWAGSRQMLARSREAGATMHAQDPLATLELWRRRAHRDPRTAPATLGLLDALASRVRATSADLDRWIASLPARERADAQLRAARVSPVLPWVLLPANDRAAVLARARSIEELSALARQVPASRLEPSAPALLARFAASPYADHECAEGPRGAPAEVAEARPPRAAAPERRSPAPGASALAPLPMASRLRWLEERAHAGDLVHLEVLQGDAREVLEVTIDRIVKRGVQRVVLCTEPDEEHGHALTLERIVAGAVVSAG